MEKRYLREKEVAALTGLSLSLLRKMRQLGRGIPYIKVGKAVRYLEDDVVKFMEDHKVNVASPFYEVSSF